jgi:hypothetical protein
MELFIRIVDGQPFEHPIMGDNFRQAFPHIDVNNLPAEFAKFERVECPYLATTFQVDEVVYQWDNGIVKDVWLVREMTDEERAAKMQQFTDDANRTVEFFKETAQGKIESAPNEEARQAWVDYLAALNAWVLVDPVNPQYPARPAVNADGTLVDLTVSGSEPNVVG